MDAIESAKQCGGAAEGHAEDHAEDHGSDSEAAGDNDEAQEDILAELDSSDTAIELTHSRVRALDGLNLARFGGLEHLGCRQNLIQDMAPVGELATLRELDLYDNRIKHIRGLAGLVRLTSLDLSFNKIRTIEGLDTLGELRELFLVSNRIQTIENLDPLGSLTYLELGANRIREIGGLDGLPALEQLFLGKNKIERLQGLGGLRRLRVLSMQSNRLTRIEGLEALEALEELYLSHNGIERIEGLERNARLTILDVSSNRIGALGGIGHLQRLEDLWASGNRLDSFANVEAVCRPLAALRTVYLEFNPLQRAQPAAYRRKLMLALPQITQIDATIFVFGKLGKDNGGGGDDGPVAAGGPASPTSPTGRGTLTSVGGVSAADTAGTVMAADFVCSERFSDNFWTTDERCISVLMHKLKSAKQTCTDILAMVAARANMEEELGKKIAKLARAGLGAEEVGGTKEALRTVRAELEANAKAHVELAKQLRAEIERPLASFISDQRLKRRTQTAIIQKTEGDRNALRTQARKLQDRRRGDTKKVGDLDLQANGLQSSGDPKLRTKLERAQAQQRATEAEYVDVRARLKEADRQWYNVWRQACDVFQVLEEERLEYLKTALWTYTNLVSTCCVSDDESMERIRQDLEKVSVANDIATFIDNFGTGEPDPALADSAAGAAPRQKKPGQAADSDDDNSNNASSAAHSSRPSRARPTAASTRSGSSAIPAPVAGPGPAQGSTAQGPAPAGSAANTVNSLSSATARSGSVMGAATPRPQTQESIRHMQRPLSMGASGPPPPHAQQQQQQPHVISSSPSWSAGGGRPGSSMQGPIMQGPAVMDGTYRRASNSDMYAMANGGGAQQQAYVPRAGSQMGMGPPDAQSSGGGYVSAPVNGMYGAADPRAPSSMGVYRGSGTSSPMLVPQQQQQQPYQQLYHPHQQPQHLQQRPGTPSQASDAGSYNMHQQQQQQQQPAHMGSPRSRAGTYNGPAHTGNFGTLTANTQIHPPPPQQQHQHGAGSAPSSPYMQQPHAANARPVSAAGMHQRSPSAMQNPMAGSRPVSAMQGSPYAMGQPAYRSGTPVQQQPPQGSPQYISMAARPPTQQQQQQQQQQQVGHSPQISAHRAPSVMGGYAMQPAHMAQQQQQQQRPMSRVETPAANAADSGKEILFYVKVLYDYDADNDKELSIREGDVISVLAVSADGWWEGEMTDRRTGRPLRGTFPSNFTDPISA
ncbi:formin-binding protein [Coemansia javaensis]|uniref:Formin-binding protein n=1 Tax=Coemansia javaensis TaxID=2761396 RepID=A0A9W8HFP4_9FUNG|nr:formin-binding protein [Coemansia javaensis]